MTVPAWHDAQGWAALLDATPSAEDRAALLRERCREIGAVPARFTTARSTCGSTCRSRG